MCAFWRRELWSVTTLKCSGKWIFRCIFIPVHFYIGMKTCVQSHIPSIDVKKIWCFQANIWVCVICTLCMKLFSAINRNCLTQASVIVLYNTGLILRLRSGLPWLFYWFSFSDQIRTYRDQPCYMLTETIIIIYFFNHMNYHCVCYFDILYSTIQSVQVFFYCLISTDLLVWVEIGFSIVEHYFLSKSHPKTLKYQFFHPLQL